MGCPSRTLLKVTTPSSLTLDSTRHLFHALILCVQLLHIRTVSHKACKWARIYPISDKVQQAQKTLGLFFQCKTSQTKCRIPNKWIIYVTSTSRDLAWLPMLFGHGVTTLTPSHRNSNRLRTVPPNYKVFCPVYDYVEKVDHSKGYWNPWKKLGVTRHFSEIIKF